MKIALALIVRGDDKEAIVLDRCLENIHPHVDGIFVTSTHKKGEKPNEQIDIVCKRYGAKVSYFEWVKDFAAARNFNFSQVPKEFDYIMWCDADDVWRGAENLHNVLKKHPMVDAFKFWYLYEFDEYKQPTVVHQKTMIVRNDGSTEWKGALHEDLMPNRQLNVELITGIERMHFTNDERVEIARKRNVEVAEEDAKLHADDPRVQWNLANSYISAGEHEKARTCFRKFIDESGSDEEIYLALLRTAEVENTLGNVKEAEALMQRALGMRPDYPDAYNQIGFYYFNKGLWEKAQDYLLAGLVKKPPYYSIIVYNPRDYDYNPMMLLAKCYYNMNRPDLALPMLKGCLKIHPKNEVLKGYITDMEKETERLEKVVTIVNNLKDVTDKEEIKKALEKVHEDLRSHPAVCAIRNKHFVKTESSGKDLVYYCGLTDHQWNPELFKKKGFGGSEEAVVNLAKQWAKAGWNVTVYNNCGTEPMVDEGVTYRPYWEFNYRDKQDVVVLWRWPRVCDYEINADKVFVDLHDVVPAGEFTEKRLARINKIFVKTQAHRVLFPNITDEKFAVVPNGMDFELFGQDVKKDPYMLVNTSSPDRSMDVLPKLFKKVKERVPQARLKWAYGFDIFDQSFADDKKKQEWKKKILAEMNDAGIENVGRLSQAECAKLYLEGSILAYPSEFYEIDCISVKKAQACGCVPVTTDFAAFDESVQYGAKVHSPKTKENWCRDFQFSFGIEDEATQNAWVDAVVKQLLSPQTNVHEMKEWTKKFAWDLIADQWLKQF